MISKIIKTNEVIPVNCKICGAALTEEMERCPLCASPVEQECPPVTEEEAVFPSMEEPPAEIPESDDPFDAADTDFAEPVAVKGSRNRLPVLIPVTLMAVLLIVGTCLFFFRPKDTPQMPQPTEPSAPAQTKPPAPPAAGREEPTGEDDGLRSEDFVPARENCFRLTEEGLVFLADRYEGSQVLVIPNEIDGVAVTAIAPEGFRNCHGISTVILPDHLEVIGDRAFAGCEEIRGLWMPDTMKHIGAGAFEGCIGIESVAVNGGMESIGENAFSGCARLLYFFYDGYYEDWLELYNEYVTPFTSVSCIDGDYYHGVEMP